MTIKYHDPSEHPRCETCLLSTDNLERDEAILCHLSRVREDKIPARLRVWFCEKGLWWVETEPPQKPELPPPNGGEWEYVEVRYQTSEPPYGFEAMLRLHEAAMMGG